MGRRLPPAILLALLLGCAPVLPDDIRAVRVETVGAAPAFCRGFGRDGITYFWRRTPDVIAVRKTAFPLVMKCEKEGFRKAVYIVEGEAPRRRQKEGGPDVGGGIRKLEEVLRLRRAPGEGHILVRIPLEPLGKEGAKKKGAPKEKRSN